MESNQPRALPGCCCFGQTGGSEQHTAWLMLPGLGMFQGLLVVVCRYCYIASLLLPPAFFTVSGPWLYDGFMIYNNSFRFHLQVCLLLKYLMLALFLVWKSHLRLAFPFFLIWFHKHTRFQKYTLICWNVPPLCTMISPGAVMGAATGAGSTHTSDPYLIIILGSWSLGEWSINTESR